MKEKKLKRKREMKREVAEEKQRSKSLSKSIRVFSGRRCETLFVCHIGYALDFVYWYRKIDLSCWMRVLDMILISWRTHPQYWWQTEAQLHNMIYRPALDVLHINAYLRINVIYLFWVLISFRDILKDLKRHKDEDVLKGQAVKNQKVWLLFVYSEP